MSIHCVKIVNEALGCFKMLKITISDLKTNEDFFFFFLKSPSFIFYILNIVAIRVIAYVLSSSLNIRWRCLYFQFKKNHVGLFLQTPMFAGATLNSKLRLFRPLFFLNLQAFCDKNVIELSPICDRIVSLTSENCLPS